MTIDGNLRSRGQRAPRGRNDARAADRRSATRRRRAARRRSTRWSWPARSSSPGRSAAGRPRRCPAPRRRARPTRPAHAGRGRRRRARPAVMSLSPRLNSRTSSPRLCACTRMPSSFHSTLARPISAMRIGDTRRRAGQHRLHGRQRSQADVERLTGQRADCRGTEVAQQHRRPAHRGDRLCRWPWRPRRPPHLRWPPGAARR